MCKLIEKMGVFLFNKEKRVIFLAQYGFYNYMSDINFLKMQFKSAVGYKLNLEDPKTYNEKLQWLKLYNRDPKYTRLVDKNEVKNIVSELIGEKYIIQTLGLWEKFEDIDFKQLPHQFVLKCTHDSGGVIICNDKEKFDFAEARRKINHSLKRNYYIQTREWPYKNVKPRIIAEQYMVDESGYELKDYKVFCFDGIARAIQVDYGRFSEHKRNIYTINWDYIDMSICYPTDRTHIIDKPYKLEEMLQLASILSKGIPHARVDFYSIKDQLYFGEITLYHGAGYETFSPSKWGEQFGEWIALPEKRIE